MKKNKGIKGKNRVHADFANDLKFHEQATKEFIFKFGQQLKLTKSPNRKSNLIYNGSDGVILKIDTWRMNETPNFFIERYKKANVDGGPWRAKKYRNKYLIYWFYNDNKAYFFKVDDLLNEMIDISRTHTLSKVRNAGYVTEGYKVHRSKLMPIAKEISTKVDKDPVSTFF